ncbi:MAG: hydantoinase/oxoprolinase family protein, partial [Mesorhizobium sp.]
TGPVCYSRGGTEPTVSDANAVLGYLPPRLLGGDMALDIDSARTAVSGIGEKLGLSVENAASGILQIANEVMLGALRVITIQRGLDPRDFGILAFGGAGPLHANALAQLLGCYPVVVPNNPGVLSALGFLEAEFKNEFVQTFIRSSRMVEPAMIWDRFQELRARGRAWLDEQEVTEGDRKLVYSLDLRYEQQGYEVSVDIDPALVESAGALEPIYDQFHALHERLYGVKFHVPVELVALRVVATGATPPVDQQPVFADGNDLSAALMETRPAYFDGSWLDTPNYDRAKLAVGMRVEGPAIIRQYDSTTVLLPRHYAEVDQFGNLQIWPSKKGN